MNQHNEFLAGILRNSARAMAGYASRELLEKHPEAAEGFEPDAFAGWQNWLTARVVELAAAVAANRSQLFTSQVQWGKTLFQSRGLPPDFFRQGLFYLNEVLATDLPDQVQGVATEYVGQALDAFHESSGDPTAPLLPDTELGRVASNYLLAVLEGDRQRASQLVLDALDRGHAVPDLYMQVLLPAQKEMGRLWLANDINVAEEHSASQTTKMVMARLRPLAQVEPANGKTMLGASVAGNEHDIGLQAVADFFEMNGWRTASLGANVPTRDLVEAIDGFGVDLLGLSVSLTTQLDTVNTAIHAVRESQRDKDRDVKILLGGGAVGESRRTGNRSGSRQLRPRSQGSRCRGSTTRVPRLGSRAS